MSQLYKFKKLKSKKIIIIENGPHYRYVDDLWLLYSKEGKEILKNIEIFIENFGKPVILQTDNGKEFDNQYLKTY